MIKFNPVEVQRALSDLARACMHFANSIVVTNEDVMEARQQEVLRRVASGSSVTQPQPQPAKPQHRPAQPPAPKAERQERPSEDREQVPERRREEPQDRDSGLPEKPMKMARMHEFLEKEWLPSTKAKEIRVMSGYFAGSGCSVGGKEYVVKAVYSNGVALVNSKGTQYHRLERVEELEKLFPAPSGVQASYQNGQSVDVGYGMKGSAKATNFVRARVEGVRGDTVTVKIAGNGVVTTAKAHTLRPAKA